MKSPKKSSFVNLMKKPISSLTGSMLLFSALLLSINTMPEPSNENESVFFKMLSTNLQNIELQKPEKDLENFRIKILTKKLKEKEETNKKSLLLMKKLLKDSSKNELKF